MHVYNHHGSEEVRGVESLALANFGGHTMVPVPGSYPDLIGGSVDAYGAGGPDRQYDMERYKLPFDQGAP